MFADPSQQDRCAVIQGTREQIYKATELITELVQRSCAQSGPQVREGRSTNAPGLRLAFERITVLQLIPGALVTRKVVWFSKLDQLFVGARHVLHARAREQDRPRHWQGRGDDQAGTVEEAGWLSTTDFIRHINFLSLSSAHLKNPLSSCTVCARQFVRSFWLDEHGTAHGDECSLWCHMCAIPKPGSITPP